MATIIETLSALAACLCAQITVDGSPEPCWCGVSPGGEALFEPLGDDCDGGMAWVRLGSSYPSSIVGQADINPANCAQGTGIDIEVGIVRVVPVEEDAPDPAMSLAITEQQIKDMWTIRRAIKCCPVIEANSLILGTYTPLGPLGAVVGGSWNAFIGLT